MKIKQTKENIEAAIVYSEELKMLVCSLCEDVKDSSSAPEAWKKINRFYHDAESMKTFHNSECVKYLAN